MSSKNKKKSKNKNKKINVKFRSIYTHKKINYTWIAIVTVITFFVAMLLGYVSLVLMDIVNLVLAIILLLIIVFIGIFFDLLGIAVTAAEETPFNSMAAGKVRGAKEAILIIRHAGSVSNFFNDVIGDISGIVSGAAATAIVVKVNLLMPTVQAIVISLVLTAIIAALTVGGKAVGKEIALRHSNYIVYRIGLIISR